MGVDHTAKLYFGWRITEEEAAKLVGWAPDSKYSLAEVLEDGFEGFQIVETGYGAYRSGGAYYYLSLLNPKAERTLLSLMRAHAEAGRARAYASAHGVELKGPPLLGAGVLMW